jgi:ubiquinone/menaquinone biosynthesis C-methylase UbiE/DNA-binding transcriptional ArsR family regulator
MPSILKSLRFLADDTRLRLLLVLRQEELSVAELCEILGMGQSRISSHLAQLRTAQLVTDRRAGKNIYYAASAEAAARELVTILDAAARELPEAKADQRGLKVARSKRADLSREYFNRMAGRFGRTYCPGRTWQGVSRMLFALVPPMVIVDLGAGEGHLSQLLAKGARAVIAVDSSEKMVEYGTQLALANGITNMEYRLGDMEDPPVEPESVDLVLLSQALHHAANPLRVLRSAHRILRPGGRVAVLDLLAHQSEQARELYADVWLGFTEADLTGFLEDAGFCAVSAEVVSKDEQNPIFQTLLGLGIRA